MVSLLCSVNLRAPLVEVAAGPRFTDAPPFESAEELDEFFQQASPTSAPADSVISSGEGLSTPPRTPRSIFRRRLDEKPFPIVESPPKPILDDPAMRPVSPASPIGSPPEVPPCGIASIVGGAQRDLLAAVDAFAKSAACRCPTWVPAGRVAGGRGASASRVKPRSSEARGVLASSSLGEATIHFAVGAELGSPRWLPSQSNR
ncbi:unnamed protein product [Phytophthora fragariaefolia]|uniref:Unnamed protein product n=1 Tax=Phytophthora fragariaefolia TaxID=1490495 RepID=A0A9W6Y0C8_9STRA|nr:unnamed protein product [Phytophthora fragariaefolia]